MAVKNANDGIGLIQTMDGASEEVVNMLQRQRELSIQSLNGTYNNANRAQMNTEFQQLTKEINRVGTTTKFNQVDLMAHMSANGSVLSTKASATELQIGWQVAGMTGSRNKLGVSRFNFTTQFSGSLANGNIFGTFTFVSANGSKILSAKGTSYGAQGISTQASASVAVMRIDSALSNIGTVRAKWGAMQNRLEYTVSNLQNVNENIQAARSRIQDTDYARESANLARTQVLQQAGMSMLSQSNQMSQNVMSLLK
jgi:flagellin